MHEQEYGVPSRTATTEKMRPGAQEVEKRDFYSLISLTSLVALLRFHCPMSWLKTRLYSNMSCCESRGSGAIMLTMMGVVAIVLDKQKKFVRLCLDVVLMKNKYYNLTCIDAMD